jgi:transposase
VALAQEVISCYEAGPTGFWLHRKLTALGVRNYVVCPTCLDERHHGVANDRTDALELATRLDRYVAGNDRALAVVGVPTEAEEQKRAHKRQRQQLREQRLSLAAQGRRLSQGQWKSVLLNPKAHARARKRAIIAFARQLFIDLWRWQTGRRTPEQLGWVMTQG